MKSELFMIIIIAAQLSYSQTWSTNITVSSAGSPPVSRVLTYGQDANATNDLDPELGEIELPPKPPTEIFDVRFELPDSPEIQSWKDFRKDTADIIDWLISFQPGDSGYPLLFRWNISEFPGDTNMSFFVRDTITGEIVNVNMRVDSSLSLFNVDVKSLRTHKEVVTPIMLKVGWNLVSVPRVQSNYNWSAIFPDASGGAFWFDPESGSYTNPAMLEMAKGYWVFYSTPQTAIISGPALVSITLNCKVGWNLVGSRQVAEPVSSLQFSGAGSKAGDAYAYDPDSGSYLPVDVINPGQSVWMFIKDGDCTITFP